MSRFRDWLAVALLMAAFKVAPKRVGIEFGALLERCGYSVVKTDDLAMMEARK